MSHVRGTFLANRCAPMRTHLRVCSASVLAFPPELHSRTSLSTDLRIAKGAL